jgi:hypothetical protein
VICLSIKNSASAGPYSSNTAFLYPLAVPVTLLAILVYQGMFGSSTTLVSNSSRMFNLLSFVIF